MHANIAYNTILNKSSIFEPISGIDGKNSPLKSLNFQQISGWLPAIQALFPIPLQELNGAVGANTGMLALVEAQAGFKIVAYEAIGEWR